jgi:hypothetical protein
VATPKALTVEERRELDRYLAGTPVPPLQTEGETGQRIVFEQRRLSGLLTVLGLQPSQISAQVYADLQKPGGGTHDGSKKLRERLSTARLKYEREALEFYRHKPSMNEFFKANDTTARDFGAPAPIAGKGEAAGNSQDNGPFYAAVAIAAYLFFRR